MSEFREPSDGTAAGASAAPAQASIAAAPSSALRAPRSIQPLPDQL